MKLSSVVPLLFAATLVLFGQEAMPRMSSAEPGNGKAGDVIAIAGENLDKANVGKVYFTDGKNDLECEVTGQTATEIKVQDTGQGDRPDGADDSDCRQGAQADRAAGKSNH